MGDAVFRLNLNQSNNKRKKKKMVRDANELCMTPDAPVRKMIDMNDLNNQPNPSISKPSIDFYMIIKNLFI